MLSGVISVDIIRKDWMEESTRRVMFSTGRDNWETPDGLFDRLNTRYHFYLDAAADATNHKCANWFGPDGIAEDALSQDWVPYLKQGNIWLNPPYSRGLQVRFIQKALQTRLEVDIRSCPNRIVCLLPARTDTKLFHDIIQPYASVEFIKGRLKFKGAKAGAPFPSMIVVF